MAEDYIVRDEGLEKQQFSSGAVRDTDDNKPRYSLIPPKPLRRVADLYTKGAQKYEANNWHKGMPTTRYLDSLIRHLELYRNGDRIEDHLAAMVFNVFGIMEFEGTEWDDLYDWGDND